MKQSTIESKSLVIALIPFICLIALLAINVFHYGEDSSSGPNQIALLFAAAIASGLAIFIYKLKWQAIQDNIVGNIRIALVACIILLLVGALTGSWLVGGIIPTMIYYGLFVFSETFFPVSACIIAAFVSLIVGSSWSTAATMGVALMGIGLTFDINPGLIAGAIISGSYFGDKMSPLSDTTNLASGVTGVELIEHIRYMSITTVPAFIITVIFFLVVGLQSHTSSSSEILQLQQAISDHFNTSFVLLIIPLLVIILIVKKVSAIPALFFGILLGCGCSLVFQQNLLSELATISDNHYKIINQAMYGQIAIVTGNAIADNLLQSGGMVGMLPTIWLIICAMIFGGSMEASQFLQKITYAIIAKAKKLGDFVACTVLASFVTNISASDQYLSVVLPGKMLINTFKEKGINPKNLSRSIEDGGSVTSVLVPWNTCAVFHASVLGVATTDYMFWTIFCLLCPFVSIIVGYTQYKTV